jgi:tetratricopeptide (TPR) repeat protein
MKRKRRATQPPRGPAGEEDSDIHVGDISGGTGFAIGPGAKSIVVQIGSLLDLAVLSELVRRHWLFLVVSIVLQAIAIALWRRYADRFLIPAGVLLVKMGLLEVGLVGGYGLKLRPQQRRLFTLLTAVSLLALAGLTGFEYRRAIYPIPFDAETFGVAVAQFGEGPEFHNTSQAREVSRLVLQRLTQQAQENPDLRFVQFRPIGLVRTEGEALEEGQRIRADLVIWGQLQVSGAATTLNFAILETPDKVSNPDFPRVVPLLETAATGILEIPGRQSEEIAAGTTTMAAFTFGLAHYLKWDFGSAARAFEEALQASPTQADTYLYLLHLYYGLTLQGLGEVKAANLQFEFADSLGLDDPAAPLGLAFGYRSLGQKEEARQWAQRAFDLCTKRLTRNPDDAMALFDRALANEVLAYTNSSRAPVQQALNDYKSAVRKAPDLFIARIGVVRMQIALDQFSEAIPMAQEAIQLSESGGANPAWAYLYLAEAHKFNNEPDQARQAYQKAAELAPEVDWIHFQAGWFYTCEKDPYRPDRGYACTADPEAAQREFEAMIAVTSNLVWAHTTLGNFFARMGRLEDAVGEYQAALEANPGAGGTWIALADTYSRLGQTEEARQAYASAVEQEPGNFYARFVYGNFLYYQGELEAAIIQWEAARQIDPQNCDLLLNLGLAYETLGDGEQAGSLYTQVVTFSVNSDAECLAEARKRLDSLTP